MAAEYPTLRCNRASAQEIPGKQHHPYEVDEDSDPCLMPEVTRPVLQNERDEGNLTETRDGQREGPYCGIECSVDGIAPTSVINTPQLRITMSATGPSNVSPKVDLRASWGAIAAYTMVQVRTPDTSMIH